jgi:hypothetical protein
LAHRLAAQPAQALRATKAALSVVMEQVSLGGMEAALMAEQSTMTSPDYLRIVTALANGGARRVSPRSQEV